MAPKLWPTSWAKVNELWSNSASWPLFRNVTKPELRDFLRNFLQNVLPKVLIKAHFHKNFIFFRFINKSFDKKLKKVYLHYLTNFFQIYYRKCSLKFLIKAHVQSAQMRNVN
jgi:hypothetical protein